MSVTKILEDLNPEQKKAVECTEGPVLIVAGAGSGKTRVLTSRIAYLVAKGVPPERILALTFTKKAAGEMKGRIASMVGQVKSRWIRMGTFHSVFVRILRDYAAYLGFPREFTIYDQSDATNAVKAVVRELGLDEKSAYKPKDVLARISKAKNDLITPTPYADGAGGYRDADISHRRSEIYRIYKRYSELCRHSGVMDFDDILLYMNILLRDNAEALQAVAGSFDYIMVDEYQDTNYAQYAILRRLCKFHHNICVVGDDSQSIYAFRGAKIENILNFRKDFPESKLFRLERNYRSTRNIVGAANSLISRNENRIPKTCVSQGEEGEKLRLMRAYSEQEEAVLIASSIIRRMHSEGASYEDFAVLYRTNSQSRAIEEQLRKRNLPYVIYSGNSFFERAEVKDMMAYLKLSVNMDDDESFRRIVNKPARGIGETSINALQAAARAGNCSLFAAAGLDGLDRFGLRDSAVAKIRSFCDMIRRHHEKAIDGDAHDTAVSLSSESGLYLLFKSDNSIEGQSRAANVEELLNSIKAFCEGRRDEFIEQLLEDGDIKDPSEVRESSIPISHLGDFLEDISLLSNADVADDETSNKVALMTVHSAKGLEFPYVFIAGLEENLFPSGNMLASERDIEEERRLFYVAITRAEKAVTISFADTRMRNGKHETNSPSRFLREIAPQYLENPLRREENFSGGSGFGFGFGSRQGGFPLRTETSREAPQRRPASFSYSAPSQPPRKTAPPAAADPDFVPDAPSTFRVGDRIEHNRFGEGEIIDMEGFGMEGKVKVSFSRYGEKLLLLKYAKMRHLQK